MAVNTMSHLEVAKNENIETDLTIFDKQQPYYSTDNVQLKFSPENIIIKR